MAEAEPLDGAAYFGREVQYAREQRDWSQRELAEKLHFNQPLVCRVETGKQFPSREFAAACDRAFGSPGVFGRLRARMTESGHPAWFVPYVQLERQAAKIQDYSNFFLMGALQTPEYAAAIFRAAHPRETDGEIKRRVEVRVQRGEILEREKPPVLWVVLHENVLRVPVGGEAVMRGQLASLLAVATRPRVTIQVFPLRAGAAGSNLPFNLLTQGDGSRILYSETHQQGHVDDSASHVAEAQDVYEQLQANALSPDDSMALIRTVMEEYTA